MNTRHSQYRGIQGACARRLIAFLLCCAMPGWLAADVLSLAGGDKLTGQLNEISEGVVFFRTAYAGMLSTPASEVEGLTTDGSFALKLSGGARIAGQFAWTRERREFILANGQEVKVDLDAIELAKPSAPEPTTLDAAGNITQLISMGDGGKIEAVTRLELTLPSGPYRFRLDVESTAGLNSDEPEPRIEAEALLHYYQTDAELAPFLRAEAALRPGPEFDNYEGLAAGVTWPVGKENEPPLQLSLGAGIRRTEYDDSKAPVWRLFGNDGGTSATEWEGMAYLDATYRRALSDKIMFSQRVRLTPVTGGNAGPWLDSRSTLDAALIPNLRLRLELAIEKESGHNMEDDWKASLGAGMSFGF